MLIPSCESLETQVHRQLQVVLVDLEALRPPAAHEQHAGRLALVAERGGEPAAEHAECFAFPGGVRVAGEDEDVAA